MVFIQSMNMCFLILNDKIDAVVEDVAVKYIFIPTVWIAKGLIQFNFTERQIFWDTRCEYVCLIYSRP